MALVGCGKKKIDVKRCTTGGHVMAKDLYIGNPFRMSYRYAKDTSDDVLILSARHGLVAPTELLAPYDYSMAQMLVSQQTDWGQSVVHELKAAYPLTHLRIVLYAGMQYVRPIMRALTVETLNYWSIEDPLLGLDLFARLRWFKDHQALVDQFGGVGEVR